MNINSSSKPLVLGTALWGWGIGKAVAYEILEKYLEGGGQTVDTATNYPINNNNSDHGLVVKWLSEWKALHPKTKLSIIVKIGATSNSGTSEIDLAPQNVIDTVKRMQDTLAESLFCISIHWDNRDGYRAFDEVKQTVDAMSKIHALGLSIGMSGIKNPELYYRANKDLANDWLIQVKENIFTSCARESYQKFFPRAKYFGYGINGGGALTGSSEIDASVNLRKLGLDPSQKAVLRVIFESRNSVAQTPRTMNELALLFAYSNNELNGVIIGPRTVNQLLDTLDCWEKLRVTKDVLERFEAVNEFIKAGRK